MIINGRVRQACSALVDHLLAEQPEEIELQPMSKFPVIRDLCVNRRRLFRALEKLHTWIPVDGYYDMGPGPRQSEADQERAYPLSECMSCGCCLDACPQYSKTEISRQAGESDEQFAARERATYDVHFVGAAAISQVMYYNSHPTGKLQANDRIDALTAPGGIQACGNAQNCVAVCPKSIPLTTSIGRAGRAATKRIFTKIFDE
jgi:succinate dehydrogenase / fumarate reductase iron-sulfur subunit